MEHRLILSGPEHLPFARSRLAALRARGVLNAAERYLIDGFTITVRVVNGVHEYIHISGGGCTLSMDSGVVDALHYVPPAAGSYDPGILYEAGRVPVYNEPFVITPPAIVRRNPANTNNGQASGTLIVQSGRFRGQPPEDAQDAESFSPGYIDNPDTDPLAPPYIPDPEDEALVAKKAAASSCPPSIFTGKTRLYVQAMFGRPMYAEHERNAEGDVTQPGEVHPYPALVAGGRPRLSLTAYKRPSDEETYAAVTIDTHTGVWLDRTTGRHWMIVVHGGTLTVYPLVSNPCGEALRGLLVEGASSIDAETLEHIEAYILSACLPYVKYAASYTIAGTVPDSMNSMGYGWHWNWSGNRADIVTSATSTSNTVPSVACMQSKHYSLTLAVTHNANTDGHSAEDFRYQHQVVFTFTAAHLETAKWAVDRSKWVWVEPIWAAPPYGSKMTPKASGLFSCNAPFYAYYNRDELQVCRVVVTETEAFTERRMSDGWDPDAAIHPGITFGLNSGFFEQLNVSKFYTLNIHVGGSSYGPLYHNNIRTGNREDIKNKSVADPGEDSTGRELDALNTADTQVSYYDGSGSLQSTFVSASPAAPKRIGGTLGSVQYDYVTSTTQEIYYSVAVVLVPIMDAEAVFVRANSDFYRYVSEGNVSTNETSAYLQPIRITPCDAGGVPNGSSTFIPSWFAADKYGSNSVLPQNTFIGSSTENEEETYTTLFDTKRLVGHGGALSISFDSTFYADNNEETTAIYSTLSGTATDRPLVLSNKLATQVGLVPEVGYPIIVGWV